MVWIAKSVRERVLKNGRGLLKGHTMLAEVGSGLGLVPFKFLRHGNSVAKLLPGCKQFNIVHRVMLAIARPQRAAMRTRSGGQQIVFK